MRLGTLEGAIAFFTDRGTSVTFTGPDDEGRETVAGRRAVVVASGDGGEQPRATPETTVRYTFRFYGDSDLEALAAYEEAKAACYSAIPGVLLCNTNVRGARWLKWFMLYAPTGPIAEPETERPVVVAVGIGKWAN